MAVANGKLAKALTTGMAGASTVTLVHESVRRLRPDAPRMDVLGMRSIGKVMRRIGKRPPRRKRLHAAALVGEIVSNGLFFSLVGAGRPDRSWLRGALLGLGAGIGGVFLPPRMGLGSLPSRRTPQTKLMTVGWYLAGGLAAAATYRMLAGKSTSSSEPEIEEEDYAA